MNLGIGLSLGGVSSGQSFSVRITRPDGQIYVDHVHTSSSNVQHALFNFTFGIPALAGTWTVAVVYQGAVMRSETFSR